MRTNILHSKPHARGCTIVEHIVGISNGSRREGFCEVDSVGIGGGPTTMDSLLLKQRSVGLLPAFRAACQCTMYSRYKLDFTPSELGSSHATQEHNPRMLSTGGARQEHGNSMGINTVYRVGMPAFWMLLVAPPPHAR